MNYQDGPGPVAALGALIVFVFMGACVVVGTVLMGNLLIKIGQGLCV